MKNRKILALLLVFVMLFSTMASAATYTVVDGDMLWKIAKANGSTWQKLAEINNLKNPNLIFPGQVLTLDDTGIIPTAPTYKDGTYTGNGKGFSDGGINVSVTISGGKISAVKVTSHKETAGISDPALSKIPSAIVKANSANVDTVAGATMTSKGIISAVKNAMAKALNSEPTTPVDPIAPTVPTLKAGTYEGKAKGYKGELTVSITVDSEKITGAKIVSCVDTHGLGETAATIMVEKIAKYATLGVDSVSGCTVTSKAVLAAAEQALAASGADVDAFSKPANVPASSSEAVTTDVLVIGGGIAGLTSAIEAASAGANVILVEKLGTLGGSTVRSGGKILAAESVIQEKNGIKDNTEDFYNFLMTVGENKTDPIKTRLSAEMSGKNIAWLIANGAQFSDKMEPLHDKYTPTRGIYTVGGGGMSDGLGGGMTVPLEESARKLGVDIQLNARATKLLTNASGNVVGAEITYKDGVKANYNAKSTILATGGYDLNQDLMKQYSPLSVGAMSSGVASQNVGDGLIMARDIGAKIRADGGSVLLYLDFFGGTYEVGGLYVDGAGNRFIDESDFWFSRTAKLIHNNQKSMYYIVDENDATPQIKAVAGDKIDFAGGKYALKADSIAALGEKIGVKDALVKTVDRYNVLCKTGVDSDFSKKASLMNAVDQGPFYAIPYGTVTSGTFGGPITNEKGQVLAEKGGIINGLYAVGEVANGDLLSTEYPGSGSSIMFCVAMGRIAGQEAGKASK